MSNTQQMTYDEAYRRMPTLDRIQDDEMAHSVRQLTAHAPEYFWIRPGSYNEYHNATKRGLWHHTLKLSTAIDILAPSRLECNQIEPRDVDRAHAAAILHDQRKNGEPGSEKTLHEHDSEMAELVREESSLDEAIAHAIDAHMGGWGTEPQPQSNLAQLVHDADMLASEDECRLSVYEPVPRELREIVADTMEPPTYREESGLDDE